MADQQSIFDLQLSPIRIAMYALAGALVFDVFVKVVALIGPSAVKPIMPWVTSIAFCLVYALFSSVMSISSKDQNKYWGQALLGFLIVAAGSGLMAYLFTGIPMDEAGSFRWLYVITTFGYIAFLIIVRTMRKIVNFAIDQDNKLRGEE